MSLPPRLACQAMRQLHPEAIAAIQSKVLFSKAEELLLSRVGSVRGNGSWRGGCSGGPPCYVTPLAPLQGSQPSLDTFQDLLHKHPDVFYPSRTAKALQLHWQLMKQYYLLEDQTGERGGVLCAPLAPTDLLAPLNFPLSCSFQCSRCPKGIKCLTSRMLRTWWMTAN